MKTESPQMDWQQVALNSGPPCFHVEGPQYCGRAERWEGHGNEAFHDYVSLDGLLNAERERCARAICLFCAEPNHYGPRKKIEGSKRLWHDDLRNDCNGVVQCQAAAIFEVITNAE